MSVNHYDKSTGTLTTLANGNRVWIGTKAAHTLAVLNNTIPNNCIVYITDDFTISGSSGGGSSGSEIGGHDFNPLDFEVTDNIVSLQPSRRIFSGTEDEWNQLSVSEKTQYDYAAITNDQVIDAIFNWSTSNNTLTLNNVTSANVSILKYKHIVQVNVKSIVFSTNSNDDITLATGLEIPFDGPTYSMLFCSDSSIDVVHPAMIWVDTSGNLKAKHFGSVQQYSGSLTYFCESN